MSLGTPSSPPTWGGGPDSYHGLVKDGCLAPWAAAAQVGALHWLRGQGTASPCFLSKRPSG